MIRNIVFSLVLLFVLIVPITVDAQEVQLVIPDSVLGAEKIAIGQVRGIRTEGGMYRSNPFFRGLIFEIKSYGDKDILISYWKNKKRSSIFIHGVLTKGYEYQGKGISIKIYFTFKPIKEEFAELRWKVNKVVTPGLYANWPIC